MPLARLGLAEDAQAAPADPQDPATGIAQRKAGDEKVRAPRGRRRAASQGAHQLAPDLLLDQRDLAFAALVGVSDDAAAGLHVHCRGRVHLPAARALHPDRF
ncbi:MAG TPA: hypothetical protein VEB41_15445 [Burkholderiales bacterium]|nr:hypothetical protein [Burkholderiales bacterium]